MYARDLPSRCGLLPVPFLSEGQYGDAIRYSSFRAAESCPHTFLASPHYITTIKCETWGVGLVTALGSCLVCRAVHVLMLLTGPTIRVTVRWQIQSLVSKREMIESAPPVARYRPVGESSVVRHEAV